MLVADHRLRRLLLLRRRRRLYGLQHRPRLRLLRLLACSPAHHGCGLQNPVPAGVHVAEPCD
jgi:hypothetical protein